MTTATQLAGKVGPGMVDIAPPTDPYLRAALIEQLDASGQTILRVRRDIEQFTASDHRNHAAGMAQFLIDRTVLVVIDRPVIETRYGNRDGATRVAVTEAGRAFRPKLAVRILDQYPTLVEEAPNGEHDIPLSDTEKLSAAQAMNVDLLARLEALEKLVSRETETEDDEPATAVADAVKPKSKRRT